MARTRRRPPAGLLLTHGAGSGPDHRELLALDAAAQAIGLPVLRHSFPYRAAGRRAPDRAPVLIDSIRAAATDCVERWGIAADQLVLGGRSMGGRMCSMAIAYGLPAAGLVLVSYPLHPPGKPDSLRVEHLPRLTVPTLAVSGTRDPFGTPDELTSELSVIPGPLSMVLIDGGRHELTGRVDQLVEAFSSWISGISGG